MSAPAPARYDPLPDLSLMPAWVWRRLPRAGKLALAAGPVVGLAAVLALAPGIDRTKDERAQTEAQRAALARAEHVAQVRAEQQPRFASAPGDLLEAAGASVLADARGRVAQPILRVACEPFPSGAAPSTGRYACLAVTRQADRVATGQPYRVLIDHESGRYAFCKVVGRPGEAMIGTQPLVPLSRSCGGM